MTRAVATCPGRTVVDRDNLLARPQWSSVAEANLCEGVVCGFTNDLGRAYLSSWGPRRTTTSFALRRGRDQAPLDDAPVAGEKARLTSSLARTLSRKREGPGVHCVSDRYGAYGPRL